MNIADVTRWHMDVTPTFYRYVGQNFVFYARPSSQGLKERVESGAHRCHDHFECLMSSTAQALYVEEPHSQWIN